jgi:hypothetical protein
MVIKYTETNFCLVLCLFTPARVNLKQGAHDLGIWVVTVFQSIVAARGPSTLTKTVSLPPPRKEPRCHSPFACTFSLYFLASRRLKYALSWGSGPLGYEAVPLGEWLPTFRKNWCFWDVRKHRPTQQRMPEDLSRQELHCENLFSGQPLYSSPQINKWQYRCV